MKHVISVCLFVFCIQLLQAQSYRKTAFTAPLKTTVSLADPKITNYSPKLLHVDQHPVPFAEYGNQKQLANAQRALIPTSNASNKTLGSANNPIISKGWAGNFGGIPMDNDICVANNGTIISAVNSNIRVYDSSGNLFLARDVVDMDSVLDIFTRISDPRLLYDPKTDKYILVCFSGSRSWESNIIIGFSTTNNPLDDWNFYTLTGNPFNDSTWSDYPIISISDKDLFMTFNQIQDNIGWQTGFRQSVIYQIQKSDGYAGNALQYTLWDSIKFNGVLYRNICPAKYQETNMPDDMYFVSVRNMAMSNDSIFILHIDNSHQSGVATLTHKVVKAPLNYGYPPNVPMKNGDSLMTNDGRILAAIYENDHIHFGTNSMNPAFNNAGVYLGEIQQLSSANPSVTASIFSDLGVEYGYPSMAYMGGPGSEHRVLFTFSHCYTDSFPGVSAVYKDGSGNYSDVLRIKEGSGTFNYLSGGQERWGDYSGVQTMYNNPNEAYLTGTYANGNAYRAWIAKINNADWAVGTSTIQKENQQTTIFPNPVEERTFSIRFSLVENEQVKISLLDIQGRLIKTLINRSCNKGINEFSFNTGLLVNGNYLLLIQGEKETIATKQLLIR